ncbi:hypothetical protein N9N67_03295 [Bacteriovoracaceae bacterium]|nr:hypothetical protein [Bacteriovoracaceae bacterium]
MQIFFEDKTDLLLTEIDKPPFSHHDGKVVEIKGICDQWLDSNYVSEEMKELQERKKKLNKPWSSKGKEFTEWRIKHGKEYDQIQSRISELQTQRETAFFEFYLKNSNQVDTSNTALLGLKYIADEQNSSGRNHQFLHLSQLGHEGGRRGGIRYSGYDGKHLPKLFEMIDYKDPDFFKIIAPFSQLMTGNYDEYSKNILARLDYIIEIEGDPFKGYERFMIEFYEAGLDEEMSWRNIWPKDKGVRGHFFSKYAKKNLENIKKFNLINEKIKSLNMGDKLPKYILGFQFGLGDVYEEFNKRKKNEEIRGEYSGRMLCHHYETANDDFWRYRQDWGAMKKIVFDPKYYMKAPIKELMENLIIIFDLDKPYREELDHLFQFLYDKYKADPSLTDVRDFLIRPDMVQHLNYAENKRKLLELTVAKRLDGLVEQVEAKGKIRDVIPTLIEDINKYESKEMKHYAANYIQEKLLTNDVESELIAKELKINEYNWIEIEKLPFADSAYIAAGYFETNETRWKFLEYLIEDDRILPDDVVDEILAGIFEDKYDDPDGKARRELIKQLTDFKKDYRANGPIFRSYVLGAFLEDKYYLLSEDKYYQKIKNLLLGKNINQKSVSILFDKYLDNVEEEKVRLISGMLADYKRGKNPISLNKLLTVGGPLGDRGKQLLYSSGIVRGEMKKDLEGSFDGLPKPERDRLFERIKNGFGENYVHIEKVSDIPGVGSINYVVEVKITDAKTGIIHDVALRVQKYALEGKVSGEKKVWLGVLADLEEINDPEIDRLRANIEIMLEQAAGHLGPDGIELDMVAQRNLYSGVKEIYKGDGKYAEGWTIRAAPPLDGKNGTVDLQSLILPEFQDSMSTYQFVRGTNLRKLNDPELQNKIALDIYRTELSAIEKGQLDPEGHIGNWIIDVENKEIIRVDYDQFNQVPYKQQEVDEFKNLAAKLMATNKNERQDLKRFLKENAKSIFSLTDDLENLDDALTYVLSKGDLPSFLNPGERLLFIADELGKYYASNQGVTVVFDLAGHHKAFFGSLLRLNTFREFIKPDDFLNLYGDFLGIDLSKKKLAFGWELAKSKFKRVKEKVNDKIDDATLEVESMKRNVGYRIENLSRSIKKCMATLKEAGVGIGEAIKGAGK